jgi:hypothetical protein
VRPQFDSGTLERLLDILDSAQSFPGISGVGTLQQLGENAMGPIAIGRKNWIHLGSKEAGPRVAAIISIVETCRRLNLRVRDYLASVLPGLADFPINRVAELTPSAWAARN